MSSFDSAIVRKIINAGGAAELHRMLLGISKYCVPEITKREPISRENGLLATLATHHLEFVARHGLGVTEADSPKGFVETSHEKEFEEWLKRGAPGLVWEDILAYLRANPIA